MRKRDNRVFLFIGEERSQRALDLGLKWEDGGLCAKQLFEALKNMGINPSHVEFYNWFEWTDSPERIMFYVNRGYTLVGMGNKVGKALDDLNIKHIKIIHPAARGLIRKKERYFAHVKERLAIKKPKKIIQ